PYGIPGSEQVKKYVDIIYRHLVKINEDGSIWLNQKYFNYATGLRMVHEDKWEKLFGFKKRSPESELEAHHCNLGLAIQQVTEDVVVRMALEAKRLTKAEYLCLAGGVALNCVANGKLYSKKIFSDTFIQPAAGDAGGALGAAMAAYHIYFGKERKIPTGLDGMKGSYLGPEFSDLDVQRVCKKYNAVSAYFENYSELCKHVA